MSASNVIPGVKGFVTQPLEERFWKYVHKTANCWFWIGTFPKGRSYGQIKVNGRFEQAHKVSWELHHKRPFPIGKLACHTCDIKQCVNPEHVFPGAKSDNAKDAIHKGTMGHFGVCGNVLRQAIESCEKV